MRNALATILVLMAGALLLYALRLAWLRLRKRITQGDEAATGKFSPLQDLVGSSLTLPATERIRLEDYEPAYEPFTGAFQSPLDRMISDRWLGVWYVIATLALVALLTKLVYAPVLFLALQLPLIALCTYVVWPDANVARKMPFIWTVTAMIALFSHLAQPVPGEAGQTDWSNAAGVMMWLLLGYWIYCAVKWSLGITQRSQEKLEFVQSLELFALLFATWGAVIEIASLLVWIVLSLWRDLSVVAPSVTALFSTITLMKTAPVLRFLPLEIVVAGLLVLTALRMKDDHYVPRSLDEFLPIREESFFAPFVMALRIPVWIVIVTIEFAVHFSRLAYEACIDFAKTFFVRLTFILLSFALAPILFYFGHALMLNALHLAEAYFKASTTIIDGVKNFLAINIMMLAASCFYVLAVPALAVRYRRAQLAEFKPALREALLVEGKAYVSAIGQTFSLLGVLAFAIPVVTLLPGEPSFGVFSFIYAVVVFIGFTWYVVSREDEDEEEEEEGYEIEERTADEISPEEATALDLPSQEASKPDSDEEAARN